MTRRRRPEDEPEPPEEGPRGVDTASVYVGGVTGATGAASGTVAGYVGIADVLAGGSVSVSSNTLRLGDWPHHVALETNLGRYPLGVPSASVSSRDMQLAFQWTHGSVYRQQVRILESRGPMTVTHLRLLAHLTRRYVVEGCPEDRRVYFTLDEATRWCGYSGRGGWQFEAVVDALLRMRSVGIRTTVRWPDGSLESAVWGPIDEAWTREAVDRHGGYATLGGFMTRLIRAGSVTYLHAPTLDALADQDDYAARLWVFLETEAGPEERTDGWRYALFSAPPSYKGPEPERETPAIADLLRMSDWSRRRDVKARIDKAMRVIAAVDPRYVYTLAPGVMRRGESGMWTLTVSRRPWVRPLPPGLTSEAGTPSRASLPEPEAERVSRVAPMRKPRRALVYPESRTPPQKRGVTSYLPSSTTVVESPSRARARERTETRDKSRTRDEAIAAALAEGRPDIAALLERETGWTGVVPRVRETLDGLADRHDLTGYQWAADRIREAPADTPPGRVLRYVLDRDKAWRDAVRAEEDAEIARDRALREEERRGIPEAVREAVGSRPRPDVSLPSGQPEAAPEDEAEVRARRIAAARAVLDASLSGYAADRARATLRELGEEP